jgi:TolA-binding protein
MARGPGIPLAIAVSVGCALAAGGCADVGGEAIRQDMAQLRQDLNSTNLSVRRSRGETDAVLGQLDRRQREATEASQQLAAQLDAMQGDLGRLNARLDDMSQRLDALARQAPRSVPPAPQRPSPVVPPGPSSAVPPQAPSPAPGGSTPQAPPGVPGTSIPRAPDGDLSPEAAYQSSYLDFSKGNYPLAVSGFREFVRRYPDSDLADNAQYWIGESYFSLARSTASQGQADRVTHALEQAVQEFRKVPLNYPRGDKVPTAIYKEALALLELKQPKVAHARLQYLVDNFPQSEEAPLARERLATIATEGRREGSSP